MTPLPAWVTYLSEAGRLAPSADNSQPWRFVYDGRMLTVTFDPVRGGPLGKEHPAVLLALGSLIENLFQAAAWAGFDTRSWRQPPFPRTDRILEIPPPESEPPSDRPPPAICERHTNRAPFSRTPLPKPLARTLQTLGTDRVNTLVFTHPRDIGTLATLVRLASQLRFRTEEIHRWLADSLRFTPEEVARGDGLDVATLCLPPGGRALSRFLADWRRMAFLNRLGAYKLLARIEAAQFRRAGAIVAIVGKESDPSSWLEAGRLMERVWLELTQNGLAVQPYFVLPDQLYRLKTNTIPLPFEEEARKLAEAGTDILARRALFMLLRVGFPTREVPRSARLPQETILTNRG